MHSFLSKIKQTLLITAIITGSGYAGAELAYAMGTPITFSNLQDAAFGTVDYVGGANGNIDLGTDGTITYGAGYSGVGVGVAGRFRIGAGFFQVVDISCSTTATMANSIGNTMTISEIEVSNNAGRGVYGTGNTCNGLGNTVLSVFIFFGASNDVYIGVRVDGSGGVPAGPGFFSTANAGGTPMIFDVVYQ